MLKNQQIVITKAVSGDLPYIKQKIKNYWLDGRNLDIDKFFVAKDKSKKTIGFIRYIEHKEFYEPCTLAVDYYYRHRGIGSLLFEYIMSVIKKDKPVFILTHIPDFFKKYGFMTTDKYPPEIEDKINTVCKLDKDKISVMKLAGERLY